MKMIEMHIVQSFPVTCLNRDDLGSPKSAVFGGVERARVSSQCWKRAIRSSAKELLPGNFAGNRTRYIIEKLEKSIESKGQKENARTLAVSLADALGKIDSIENGNVKTMLYLSPMEIENISSAILGMEYSGPVETLKKTDLKGKEKEKAEKELLKLTERAAKAMKENVKDAADIALFGRMVADDHSLTLEGTSNFSHAISTHKVSSEIDFFSAVDDLKPEDTEGAGHIGTLEFNSACYYRYVGINLDLFRDKDHLNHFSTDERKKVLDAFIRACLMANPTARKNSMFGYSFPSYVLGLRRTGQPLSLANAFEKPIFSHDGYEKKSEEKLKEYFEFMKKTWNISTDVKTEIPTLGIDKFIESLLNSEV
ncbi:MAG: type I-E CRISPR-associated protein Cas7/Cse4/CasC [Victivallales bacterium]